MVNITKPLYTTKCIHIIEVIEMKNTKNQKPKTLTDEEYRARVDAVEQLEAEHDILDTENFGVKEPYYGGCF